MNTRLVKDSEVEQRVFEAIQFITFNLDPNIKPILDKAYLNEQDPLAKDVLTSIITNIGLAKTNLIPLCQDTGTLVVFAELGNRVLIEGKTLEQAINKALARATETCYLRATVLSDPLFNRVNLGTNLPAIVHTKIVEGSELHLNIAQKGGGAENMSRLKMFNPSACPQDIIDYVVETVSLAGSKACPPLIVGVGIGGNFEQCALLAKKALFVDIYAKHPDPSYRDMEKDMLIAINETKIGAQGMGGNLTALAVHIMTAPCHIASLPVAVNLQCHSHRHLAITI
ncbi:MAG: fumarate hydratase [Candidatus Cloacimonetes bacterium]|jgi:fumarate hydratase subunit alpha|nr:fumarate hydratase [Candidatus Cloacimonadota bacterium]